MAIIRSKPERSFTVLNNAMLNDTRLSFDDLGLLVYLLSKPAHWKISVSALQAERKHGRDWVYKRLSNLAEAGYMVRLRSRGDDGKLGEIDYHVYDEPQQAAPLTEKPDVEPLPEKPDLAKPDTANPILESNEDKKILNSENPGVAAAPKFSADDLKAAEWMFQRVLDLDDKFKQPNLEKWADEVRLMRERDGRTLTDICQTFGWANRHHFWKANIKSPGKLRQQFSTLLIQRNSELESHEAKTRNPGAANVAARIADIHDTSWANRTGTAQ